MLRIDVAISNARRRVGDPPRLEAIEPELRKSINGELCCQRVRPRSLEAVALGIIAHAWQPCGHDPVWVKPVATKLISANVGSPSHHADRCDHGPSSTASCGCPEHVPA